MSRMSRIDTTALKTDPNLVLVSQLNKIMPCDDVVKGIEDGTIDIRLMTEDADEFAAMLEGRSELTKNRINEAIRKKLNPQANLAEENEKLKKEVLRLRKAAEDSNINASKAEEEVERKKAEIEKLTKELADAKATDITKLQDDLKAAKSEADAAKAEAKTAKEDLDKAKADADTAKTDLATAKSEAATAKSEADAAKAEADGLKKKLAEAEAKNVELENKLASKQVITPVASPVPSQVVAIGAEPDVVQIKDSKTGELSNAYITYDGKAINSQYAFQTLKNFPEKFKAEEFPAVFFKELNGNIKLKEKTGDTVEDLYE